MNHQFQPNPNEPIKCIDCAHAEILHGPDAICESCNNTGELNPYGLGNTEALLCRDCIEREKQYLLNAIAYQAPELQQERLDIHNAITRPYDRMIAEARRIDEQIHLSTDIFCAKTVAFDDLRKAIYADDTIEPDKKFFEMARIAKERILHFQHIIFDLDKKKIEAYSEQKAWHVSLNDIANKLRVDEREQLRISDITYDVKMPKVVTPRTIKIAPKKASKEELKTLASELKMPEFTIQLIMTSKNWTIEQVGNHLRKTINEGKSMVSINLTPIEHGEKLNPYPETNETNGEIK